MNNPENKLKKLILIAFALSGMTALIYEVIWAKPLQLIFGSTIYAVSTMLMTFFVGFALGAYLFRNLADKTNKPLRIFALLEIGIGLYGLVIFKLFKILPSIYINFEVILGMQFIKFLIIFLVLIIPTTLFGATWPIVNKVYVNPEKIGKETGKLYSFNSFGSFLGAILSGFILLPLFGITTTGIIAASLNILIGIVALIYSKKNRGENGT
jgi:spermidine synthase